MKKVGILTLNGLDNYGNRLQNYALKKIIESLGYKVETVWLESLKEKFIRKIKEILYFPTLKKRRIKFLVFSNKYLNVKYITNKEKLNDYDYLVVGSDQVWNYTFNSFDPIYLLNLDYIPNEKKISYAASIGIDKIDKKHRELFKDALEKFNKLSVREISAKKLIENLSNKIHVEVSLDPTLLISKNEWTKLSRVPKCLPQKYILLYYLGKIPKDDYDKIKKYAAENSCTILNLLDQSQQYYKTGPQEFLGIIKNAELVCTDSFHATVFSFIFDKPFLIFNRQDKEKDMTTRLNSFLETFELYNKKFNGKNITKENLSIDYTNAKKRLASEIIESTEYLKKSLK